MRVDACYLTCYSANQIYLASCSSSCVGGFMWRVGGMYGGNVLVVLTVTTMVNHFVRN